ncbi:transcription factor IIIB 90 kDa subunit [Anthonomus grandis grandis]|uniref:transcription factor IIIB 90 kDa subunit n=1 Tax=Anthonomus grandis grandis TaxID=2921223 RepID=UPI002166106E|nr:transcription factor IIIB 90 kDa subunit [Anthonomus grandis grandis]
MSSGRKCKNCGSSDIEVDPARGDAVCTNCGSVLEENVIVAEVQYEEGAHGTSSAIGQFVASDSKGGSAKFGASFHVRSHGVESREVTLNKARNGITQLGVQLKLNQHCIDTACNFFKMALSRNLTRGRRNTHIHAACIYLSCRTEGTAHLLIDISDVLQICCYELGRTYLRMSQALCINVPSVDPCLYILRFASKLEFGAKTQQVTNTALRLVQRMKRDSLHSGRRPSGLCGAALLIASRLHEFNRSIGDVIKVVKVHESTMRKRLIEFGETPSSALTLDEFMTVDLEEEQDPPAFKAARKKDKERLQKLLEEESEGFTDLQRQIEQQLEQTQSRKLYPLKGTSKKLEHHETSQFIHESTMGTINAILEQDLDDPEPVELVGLGPNIESIGLPSSLDDTANAPKGQIAEEIDMDLNFDDLDDEEIDSYIMSVPEYEMKSEIWHELNADYLQKVKEKEERLQKEREEGKPEKKPRKRPARKPKTAPASSAGEAIEKIIQEKKISSKINYDVLKNLKTAPANVEVPIKEDISPTTSDSIKRRRLSSVSSLTSVDDQSFKKPAKSRKLVDVGLPFLDDSPATSKVQDKPVPEPQKVDHVSEEEDYEEDFDEDVEPQNESANEMGVMQLLKQHQENEVGGGKRVWI